ncbi:unnamed protein product [Calypogeia fissa]
MCLMELLGTAKKMNFMVFPLTSLSNLHARGEESLKSCGGDELREPRGSRGRASHERAASASDLAARLTNAGLDLGTLGSPSC